MFIYHGRNFEASSIGVRLVEVVCDQCGTKYFYELLRIGSGAGTAPYWIGQGSAERSATIGARRDLDKRLNDEAELVPCPKCHWINDHLIAGYRRGCYRGAARNAAAIGFLGACVTLTTAWAWTLGLTRDRDSLISIITWGMTISISIPIAILSLRHFLRQRTQPNRDYPVHPKLPIGTSSALIPEPATGQLKAAGQPTKKWGDASGNLMDYRVGRSTLPPLCCDCLARDPGCSVYRYPFGAGTEIMIPLCKRCAKHWTWRKCLGAVVTIAAAVAFGVPILLALRLDEIFFWFAIFVLFALLPIVGAMIAGRWTAPVRVKSTVFSRGVARLWFRNGDYLNEVAAHHAR
jgi:hypothetical protein